MNHNPRPFTAEDQQKATSARRRIPPEERSQLARQAAEARWAPRPMGAHERGMVSCLACLATGKAIGTDGTYIRFPAHAHPYSWEGPLLSFSMLRHHDRQMRRAPRSDVELLRAHELDHLRRFIQYVNTTTEDPRRSTARRCRRCVVVSRCEPGSRGWP